MRRSHRRDARQGGTQDSYSVVRAPEPETTPQPEREGAAAASRERLEQELQQLRQAMESRPAIDMARGVLVKVFRCPPEEAWRIMVRVGVPELQCESAECRGGSAGDGAGRALPGRPASPPCGRSPSGVRS
ncbi:ANTAR domain-containing protein [Streptomyces sp. NPDC058470]|uniref:ANTAR domain-containing protein n=1 Tax=Streptomyces sp. NPDC058470 TaxID=3346515 RepID=UPI00365E327A